MAIETEVKLLIPDLDLFRTNLGRLNPVRISERHFEDNYVLDFPGAQMRWRGRLLRIRIQVWFRYQKYREEFSVPFGKRTGEVHVALDETPVGTFAELEGKKELI